MEGWIKVYASGEMHKAEYIKTLLEEHGIIAVLINKQDSVYLFGEIELYVPVDSAFMANQLINKLDSE